MLKAYNCAIASQGLLNKAVWSKQFVFVLGVLCVLGVVVLIEVTSVINKGRGSLFINEGKLGSAHRALGQHPY